MENDEINLYDCDGYRPLHHAVLANDRHRAKSLVLQGALVNAQTESGDGILVLVCRALRDDEAVLWIAPLLNWGAEIIDRDRKNWTALHHCAARGLLKTARLLMDEGADPFYKNSDGKRPLDLVTDNVAQWSEILTIARR
ncbi:MAG: ankyrin repeat domain-containing protein [Deltaproteobacteria bacterium]|nr:ankyrin repeat domain-containing protein [Deltaproteobacteria bacterium]